MAEMTVNSGRFILSLTVMESAFIVISWFGAEMHITEQEKMSLSLFVFYLPHVFVAVCQQ